MIQDATGSLKPYLHLEKLDHVTKFSHLLKQKLVVCVVVFSPLGLSLDNFSPTMLRPQPIQWIVLKSC